MKQTQVLNVPTTVVEGEPIQYILGLLFNGEYVNQGGVEQIYATSFEEFYEKIKDTLWGKGLKQRFCSEGK